MGLDEILHLPGCPAQSGQDKMPRQLTFVIESRKYQTEPVKIDRRKLYGWTGIEATDDAGELCGVVSTDQTGRLIVPKRGMAIGLLTPSGDWVERSELKTVTAEGRKARLLPSSYNTDIVLRKKATPCEYLNHNITDFYLLSDAPEEFVLRIGEDIYTFEYCYTEGCEGSPAFLLSSGTKLFLLIGETLSFEMIGYEEPGWIQEDRSEEEEQEVDFAMF